MASTETEVQKKSRTGLLSSTHHQDNNSTIKNKRSGESEPGMRVGEGYQAVVPDVIKEGVVNNDVHVEPLLVWAPCEQIPDKTMDKYLVLAKDRFGYSIEQSLGMLYWHKYDVEKATDDLKNFTPLPDEWSMEDKVIFDQSFHSYGKSFPRIRQQLPDKSIGSLVKYYYTWKKNRNRKSLMDKGEKRDLNMINGLFAEDSNGENETSGDSDYEPNEKKLKTKKNGEKPSSPTESKPSPMLSTNCVNCAGVTSQMNLTPRGKMCVPCYGYWSRTGSLRPKGKDDQVLLYHGPQHKLKRKPPKGMQLKQEALIEVAQTHGDAHTRPLEMELINLRRQLITDQQVLQKQELAIKGRAERCKPPEITQKLNPRWTNEELLIAVQCVRCYGQQFKIMAEVVGNKSEAHCRSFFINYRRRFNLVDILREYEKENNILRSNDVWEDGEVELPITGPDIQNQSNQQVNQQDSSYPPPLRRQMDQIIWTDNTQGPPPLINNT